MPRTPALKTIVNSFFQALMSNVQLYWAVEPLSHHGYESIMENPLHATQARRIAALAFLATVDAWEQYLEAVFVRYLCGAGSPAGYRPRLRLGAAQSIDHAYQLLTGQPKYERTRHYHSWMRPQDLIDRSEVFFYQGKPFKKPIGDWQNRLTDAAVIRNRVAHSSQKAREAFKRVALEHLKRKPNTQLSQGFSVGDLLMSPTRRGFPDPTNDPYFISYMKMFQDLVKRISPLDQA